MRRILRAIFVIFAFGVGTVAPGAQAAEMVNVEYIHAAVKQKWGITVPYNAALTNPKVAANVKYLLAVVDKANEIINGEPITDYVHGEYATEYAVDTVATNDAVRRLIRELPSWSFTTTSNTTKFEFKMSAAGTFIIDWGDGAREVLNRTNTTETSYSHTYASAGAYTVTIKGVATGYSVSETTAAISFKSNTNLAGITGGLGRVFPTLADGTQPRFYQTFFSCSNLKGEISSDLFDGVVGAPVSSMFNGTFYNCSGLTSIPENLFAGIVGAPASYMFSSTFNGCSGLTSIPGNLFAGIRGAPASSMFSSTFQSCSGLTSIPENLFAGIVGAPAGTMFYWTFYDCTNLTGPSARIDGKYLYEIWPDSDNTSYGTYCYKNATGLDDYATMPAPWK